MMLEDEKSFSESKSFVPSLRSDLFFIPSPHSHLFLIYLCLLIPLIATHYPLPLLALLHACLPTHPSPSLQQSNHVF